jgi:hypothetical protein
MATGSFRRENLEFLVACHGSQTSFANAVRYRSLTQPIVSSILHRRRALHEFEARAVERSLSIPEGWMDRYSLRKAWLHIRKIRQMDPEAQRVVHALLKFVSEN